MGKGASSEKVVREIQRHTRPVTFPSVWSCSSKSVFRFEAGQRSQCDNAACAPGQDVPCAIG
jgi:hypothetical protein